MNETKVIYHIDEEQTPYLVKIPIGPDKVTLGDFKQVLNKPNYKFFFKSVDDDFGVVKEEIADDMAPLPCFNGRVVSWLVTAEGSNQSDNNSEVPPSETDSVMGRDRVGFNRKPAGGLCYRAASVMSSDLDATSLVDTESEITLDRDMTECSSVSRLQLSRKRQTQRRRKRPPTLSRTSSYSSITDSTMSLNIITVSLNMDTVNFLGISIVGQSNTGGDGGIYVGSIMKGGAVALDGRIEPGDMILQVNDVNFENMSNDEAVRVLREAVQKTVPIKLVVAKCWDPQPKGYFTIPRTEPVRPIDPGAWVAHTAALRSHENTIPELSESPESQLNVNMDMAEIVKVMSRPDSGLEIRDRLWLKITIPNAFIGADVVDWVLAHVHGLADRRDARKYVSLMLRRGHIRHTVNKPSFSEQCYYVLGDPSLVHEMSALNLGENESIISDVTPLPNPPMYMPYSGNYTPSHGYQPIQYSCGNLDQRVLSSGSSSSDALTTKDMAASQSDVTSIQQPNMCSASRSSDSSNKQDQDISVLSYL